MQGRLAKLLASEKIHVSELERSRAEKSQLEERLENASFRYMMAEKKLDRAKSAAVAKMEKQAILGPRKDSGASGDAEQPSTKQEDTVMTNGTHEGNEPNPELEEAHKKALAASAKQKQQLDQLVAENDKLTKELTALNIKVSHLTDEDYARTDLFKNMKSQHEDVIKRINHLEALSTQLREENGKLQSERTTYQTHIETESQTAIGEKEAQLAKAENDLARIRNGRDELLADQQMRKAAQDQERTSLGQIQELAAAREARIQALESEAERLRTVLAQSENSEKPKPELESLSSAELAVKVHNLEQSDSMLNRELSSMMDAYNRSKKAAAKNVEELTLLEDRLARAVAEKSKADQKYFAAMKAKETRDNEVRTLRAQNARSSDIVTQLKEAEASTRAVMINLEKQLTETKDAVSSISAQYRSSQQQVSQDNITIEGFKSQIAELKKQLVSKDTSAALSAASLRQAETQIEELKVSLDGVKKKLESRTPGVTGTQSEAAGLDYRVRPVLISALILAKADNDSELDLLPRLPTQSQEYSHQDVWPFYLPAMRGRTACLTTTKVSSLPEGLRHQRLHACSDRGLSRLCTIPSICFELWGTRRKFYNLRL